jgi:hypothetical protein
VTFNEPSGNHLDEVAIYSNVDCSVQFCFLLNVDGVIFHKEVLF